MRKSCSVLTLLVISCGAWGQPQKSDASDTKRSTESRVRASPEMERLLNAFVGKCVVKETLHNARTVLNDYRNIGDKLWARFNKEASKKDQLDYYQALVTAFRSADAPLQWWPSLIGS